DVACEAFGKPPRPLTRAPRIGHHSSPQHTRAAVPSAHHVDSTVTRLVIASAARLEFPPVGNDTLYDESTAVDAGCAQCQGMLSGAASRSPCGRTSTAKARRPSWPADRRITSKRGMANP